MATFAKMPVKFFWFIRLVPQTPLEQEETLFSAANLKRLLRNPLSLSIGEITRWQELIKGNPKIFDLIRFARKLGKRVDGHTAGQIMKPHHFPAGVESCLKALTLRRPQRRDWDST
jgi:adenine deaminase